MKIHYRLTVEDFLQYHEYTRERAWRKFRWCWRWLPAMALAALVPAAADGYADPLSLMLGFGLGGLWAAMIPWLLRRSARKRLLRAWRGRDDLGGERDLELADGGLVETGPGRPVEAEWGLVHKVAVNGTRLYIYLDAPRVIIVPLEAFGDIMRYNEFMARLGTGTGLPLDILKVSENFDADSAGPPRSRRRRGRLLRGRGRRA